MRPLAPAARPLDDVRYEIEGERYGLEDYMEVKYLCFDING